MAVPDRFEIEDILVQNVSGVLFRALEISTGRTVALRRLFPFGPTGGGLEERGQSAYQAAVKRLSTVKHPALRSVISGGCDAIDGMPFIATEWIEGTPLSNFLAHAPLAPAEAIELLSKALEVCELLADSLGQEGVWVEIDPDTIVVGAEGTGRGYTFWISPLKWLETEGGRQGLYSLVELTASVMYWKGGVRSAQSSDGLGSWFEWLRASASEATLREAREKLDFFTSPQAPVAPVPSTAPPQEPVPGPAKNAKGLPVLIMCAVCAALGAGGWYIARKNPALLSEFSTNSVTKIFQSSPEDSSAPRALTTADVLNSIPFTPADREALLSKEGETIVLEGIFQKIDSSSSRETMYLLFARKLEPTDIRGAISTGSIPVGMTEKELAPLFGKKVRLHGTVKLEEHDKPVVVLDKRSAIEVIE